MKIIVKHKDTEVTLIEEGNNDKLSSLRWEDQADRIHKTIRVISDEIIKLNALTNEDTKEQQ